MDKLSPKQREELRQAFDKFDLDCSGKISAKEFHKVMCAMGQNPSMKKVKEMIASVDIDHNGLIDFPEFCTMMQANMKNTDQMRHELEKAFDHFDKDKNGYISEPELRQALCNCGEKLTHQELDQMIEQADLDRDGKIDKQEFIAVIMGEKSVIRG